MTRILLVWLLMAAAELCTGQKAGTVEGQVIDDRGQLIAGATVLLEGLDYQGPKLFIRRADTGPDGRFVLNNISWGRYSLDAQKESDGYPNPTMMFYRDHYTKVITLSPILSVVNSTVQLGPKAGRILPLAPLDAVSQKPIRSASIRLSRKVRKDDGTEHETYLTTNADADNLFVPSRVDVSILVSSPGYQDWYYPGVSEAAQATPLFLQPGDLVSLNVSLVPVPSKP